MSTIFSAPRKAASGFFERINNAAATPAFGLGLGLLQGDPQGGMRNAFFLTQAANQRAALEQRQLQAAQQAQAQAAAAGARAKQQTFQNEMALRKDARAQAEFERGPADTSIIKDAQYLYPDDIQKQREHIRRRTLKPASQVTVNTGQQQSEFQKGIGKFQAEQFTGFQSEAQEANNQLASVAQLEELLASGVATGPLAQASLPLRRFAADLGLNVNDASIAGQETFRTVTNQMALRLRNPESGMGLTGATSDRDLKFLKESVPGLEKTEAGNRLIIDFYKRAQRRKIEVAQLAEQYAAQHGNLTGFAQHARRWADENPLFTAADVEAVKGAAAATGGGLSRDERAELEALRKELGQGTSGKSWSGCGSSSACKSWRRRRPPQARRRRRRRRPECASRTLPDAPQTPPCSTSATKSAPRASPALAAGLWAWRTPSVNVTCRRSRER